MPSEPSLADLRTEVAAARCREQAKRRERGARSVDLIEARAGTLAALEQYAAAIAARSWPVPRTVAQEILLRRRLLSPPRWGGGR